MRTTTKGITFVLMLLPMFIGACVGLLHVGFEAGYQGTVNAIDDLFN